MADQGVAASTSPMSACSEDPRVERTRRAVLGAVRELALESGPASVSHQAVADRSGVGRATLYRHWPDRNALLLDALRPTGASTPRPVTGDLRADLVGTLRRMRVAVTRSSGTPLFLAMVGHGDGDPAIEALRRELVAEGESEMRAILADALEDGRLPATSDIDVIVAQLSGPIVYRRMVAGRPIPRGMVDQVVDAVLAGLTRPGRG